MAKGDYLPEDEYGQTWLVRAGDPAHLLCDGLPRMLRANYFVLPRATIRTGTVTGQQLEQCQYRLTRLAGFAAEDPQIAESMLRYNAMEHCLKALLGIT